MPNGSPNTVTTNPIIYSHRCAVRTTIPEWRDATLELSNRDIRVVRIGSCPEVHHDLAALALDVMATDAAIPLMGMEHGLAAAEWTWQEFIHGTYLRTHYHRTTRSFGLPVTTGLRRRLRVFFAI